MPNLDFYSFAEDQKAVLDTVFDLGRFRVFEAYSGFEMDLRELHSPDDLDTAPPGMWLELFVLGSGPDPTIRRIELSTGAPGGATFRYRCEGWGLVQLQFFSLVGGAELRWSHTNHNTEKRAHRWAETTPRLGSPAAWDWPEITRASGQLNRRIRAMEVSRIGSRPVLPRAAEVIDQRGLRHVWGLGIHAESRQYRP